MHTRTAPTAQPRITSKELALVGVGGAIGTLARHGLGVVLPDVSGLPTATLLVDVVGSLTLGVLVRALTRTIPSPTRRHDLYLILGTGVLGGFTTYSGLAASTADLARHGRPILAVTTAVATVLSGTLAAYTGVVLGDRVGPARPGPESSSRPNTAPGRTSPPETGGR